MNARVFTVSKPYPPGEVNDDALEVFCRDLAHKLGEVLFDSDCSMLLRGPDGVVSLSVKVVVPEAVQEAEREAAPRIFLPN